MDHDELRKHIDCAGRDSFRLYALTARMVAACWPGGSQDRTERSALEWVRRWHPERARAVLPTCSCATGRCAVCN